MPSHLDQLIESMQQGDGHVVVDAAAGETPLVAILFVLGEEMFECGVSSAEAARLVRAGARVTRQAERRLQS
jgi:hypothetical protein